MASRFLGRVGVGVAGVAALMTGMVGPASADSVSGTVGDGGVEGLTVNVGAGFLAEMPTSLIEFRLGDGTELGVYCVEIRTEIDPEHPLVEKDWEEYPDKGSPFNRNRDKINWILHNGFPVVDTRELSAKLTSRGVRLTDGLSEAEAIAGTQAAIWHFSDDTDLDRDNPVPEVEESAEDVLALYDFLTGDDNEGLDNEPAATLKISPTELSGEPGQRIGPFTVRTTGEISELVAELPEGVRITDEDGNEVEAAGIEDGTKLFIDVPADAPDDAASFELVASAEVATGRLFVGKNYSSGNKTQSVIVAQAKGAELTASAGAVWAKEVVQQAANVDDDTAAAESDLAETGASILVPTVIGVVLVGAGFGALMFLRRRRI